jgi:competence protein ComEA
MWKKFLAAAVMLCAAAMAMAAVDVNKATEAELDGVKGIGPVTSKLIVSERKKGEFKSWQDLIDRVKGVGESSAAKFSAEGVTVNGQAYKAAAATKKDDKAAAKDEKKDAKAAAKDEKKDTKAAAKDEKKDAKVAESKPAAKPAASAKK